MVIRPRHFASMPPHYGLLLIVSSLPSRLGRQNENDKDSFPLASNKRTRHKVLSHLIPWWCRLLVFAHTTGAEELNFSCYGLHKLHNFIISTLIEQFFRWEILTTLTTRSSSGAHKKFSIDIEMSALCINLTRSCVQPRVKCLIRKAFNIFHKLKPGDLIINNLNIFLTLSSTRKFHPFRCPLASSSLSKHGDCRARDLRKGNKYVKRVMWRSIDSHSRRP